jgi:hypothetical protein
MVGQNRASSDPSSNILNQLRSMYDKLTLPNARRELPGSSFSKHINNIISNQIDMRQQLAITQAVLANVRTCFVCRHP